MDPPDGQTSIPINDDGNGLGFFDSSVYESQQGTSTDYNSYGGQNFPSGQMTYSRANIGSAGKFLENKGFGWLLEENGEAESNTPLLEELDIDLTDIYYKVRCVLLPLPYFRMKLNIVRESPDFWGPLMVVLAFAILSIYGQLTVISWILTMWFCGGFMVYFIARALGGDVGYTQVLGVVGYCLIPLVCTGVLSSIFSRFSYLSSAFGIFGIIWSVYSAGTLLCVDELQSKKPLLLYPVFLLYIYFFSLYSGA